MSDRDVAQAAAHEGRSATKRTWDQFDRVGDRLDELRLLDIDEEANEQVDEAFAEIEGLVMDIDDALDDARQAFEAVIEDD